MAKRKSKKQMEQLRFGYKLVLNQWIVSLFGFDPLKDDKEGKQAMRPVQPIVDIVKDEKGMNAENLHRYYSRLKEKLPSGAKITQEDLLRYERNIVNHTSAINERRLEQPIAWKYYQWLSLLFAEIYLDRFFADKDALLEQLNAYVEEFESYWKERNYKTGITPYDADDLNKLCLQNATGSGKTLLMHVNFLQFKHYAEASSLKHDLARTILITPNEELSEQHRKEMLASGIGAHRLSTDGGVLLSYGRRGLRQVDFTEVTKLGDQDGPNVMAVRNLGDQNLLLVDEGHRGMGSRDERGWFRRRERISEKGFVFEYSATFKEAVSAASSEKIEASYAKNILFDYSYRYFYEDGYGKDYRIFNLPHPDAYTKFSYLAACLLSFYQQLRLYKDKRDIYADYNLEKPLWVFVGSSVSRAAKTGDEQKTVSDVARIISFLAEFLKNRERAAAEISKLLGGEAQNTGFLDENNNDIFTDSFDYLRHLAKDWSADQLLQDIFENLFQSESGGRLSIAQVKRSDNEIMLYAGQADRPFGLINVGDAAALTSHIAQQNFENVDVSKSEFADTLFGQISDEKSPVNLLIGSKRFVEGWDCWRVSTLGLMHVGRSEGTQIIQLFGRGVRLKGYEWSLQRSGFSTIRTQPKHIQYVETLNVFGIKSDYMERFSKFLEDEGLPSRKDVHTVKLAVTYDIGKRLKVLRPRRKRSDGREYDFRRDGAALSFGDVPKKLSRKKIEVDWYPRIQLLESRKKAGRQIERNSAVFAKEHLDFLDYDDLFFRLEKFKRERMWHNLNIDKSAIRPLLDRKDWYQLLIPAEKMNFDAFANVHLWREIACELLRKYAEQYYNYRKAAFFEPRLELREIEDGDGNFPDADRYQLIVDANESKLIEDIEKLTGDIVKRKIGTLGGDHLKGCFFGSHLYEPVLHVAKESRIRIAPVSLNKSEFQFLTDLRDYIEREQERLNSEGIEFFLLRNESRGRGIGFFEAGNFYPDFLLWQVRGDRQYLSFIEPHGLQHTGPGDPKIEFHTIIKDIEKRLPDPQVTLNSFIVTPTSFDSLEWGWSISEFENKNVLFMEDQSGDYVGKIAGRMLD